MIFPAVGRDFRAVPFLINRWVEERGLRVTEWRSLGSAGAWTYEFLHVRGSIYRLVVKDGDGRASKAMVCVGGLFHRGSPAVEILWDAFNKPELRVPPGAPASGGSVVIEREVGDGSVNAWRELGRARVRRRIGAILTTLAARTGFMRSFEKPGDLKDDGDPCGDFRGPIG